MDKERKNEVIVSDQQIEAIYTEVEQCSEEEAAELLNALLQEETTEPLPYKKTLPVILDEDSALYKKRRITEEKDYFDEEIKETEEYFAALKQLVIDNWFTTCYKPFKQILEYLGKDHLFNGVNTFSACMYAAQNMGFENITVTKRQKKEILEVFKRIQKDETINKYIDIYIKNTPPELLVGGSIQQAFLNTRYPSKDEEKALYTNRLFREAVEDELHAIPVSERMDIPHSSLKLDQLQYIADEDGSDERLIIDSIYADISYTFDNVCIFKANGSKYGIYSTETGSITDIFYDNTTDAPHTLTSITDYRISKQGTMIIGKVNNMKGDVCIVDDTIYHEIDGNRIIPTNIFNQGDYFVAQMYSNNELKTALCSKDTIFTHVRNYTDGKIYEIEEIHNIHIDKNYIEVSIHGGYILKVSINELCTP